MTDNVDFKTFDDLPEVRPTIPDDEYQVRVLAKIKDSKKGGKYISYDAIVQDGPESGYRIFNNMISFEGEQAFRFKQAVKSLGMKPPKGMTVLEAAQWFVEQINGNVYKVKVGKKPYQDRDENGEYVNVPDNFVNVVRGFIKE